MNFCVSVWQVLLGALVIVSLGLGLGLGLNRGAQEQGMFMILLV